MGRTLRNHPKTTYRYTNKARGILLASLYMGDIGVVDLLKAVSKSLKKSKTYSRRAGQSSTAKLVEWRLRPELGTDARFAQLKKKLKGKELKNLHLDRRSTSSSRVIRLVAIDY
jgi:hypothetical protein